MDDFSLLQSYIRNRNEAAFETLMQRHAGLVYSASLRLTSDAQIAEDVTQAVFIVLSRKADQLKADVVLPAWLMTVTKLIAANARRRKSAQHRVEQEAASMAQNRAEFADWQSLAPVLDDAIASLNETDRVAVVLRYFGKCSSRDIGARLGISTDAAEKRMQRALEKLRVFFARRGIAISALVLAEQLTENSVHAAPPALVASLGKVVSTAAVGAQAAPSLILAKGAMTAMAATKSITLLGIALVVVGLGAGFILRGTPSPAPPVSPSSSAPSTAVATPTATAAEKPPPVAEPPAAQSGDGSMKGVVKLDGVAPALTPRALPADKQGECKCSEVENDELVVDAASKGIKEVIVRIMDVKAPEDKTPYELPVLDQKGCRFVPHITIVKPGSDLALLNPDTIMHNFHTTPQEMISDPINKASLEKKIVIPAKGHFESPEITQVVCDVHPWMKAYLVVHDPRFVKLTGKDGAFEIKGVPPGKYKVSIFHGSLGEKIIDMEVKAGQPTDLGEIKFTSK